MKLLNLFFRHPIYCLKNLRKAWSAARAKCDAATWRRYTTPELASPHPADPKFEALCKRCGRCCRLKVILNGRHIALDQYCPFYDAQARRCMVYPYRHAVRPTCRPIPQAIREGLLPEDCPYVAPLKGHYKCRYPEINNTQKGTTP